MINGNPDYTLSWELKLTFNYSMDFIRWDGRLFFGLSFDFLGAIPNVNYTQKMIRSRQLNLRSTVEQWNKPSFCSIPTPTTSITPAISTPNTSPIKSGQQMYDEETERDSVSSLSLTSILRSSHPGRLDSQKRSKSESPRSHSLLPEVVRSRSKETDLIPRFPKPPLLPQNSGDIFCRGMEIPKQKLRLDTSVWNLQGEKVPIKSIYGHQLCVVVVLRHFGSLVRFPALAFKLTFSSIRK